MKRFLISPPFGSYISHRSAMSVMGTFTLIPRPGRGLKIAQFFWDNIRHPVMDGWRNRIGLRNPGVGALAALQSKYIYSFAGLDPTEWLALLYMLEDRRVSVSRPIIELNAGCQNAEVAPIPKAAMVGFTSHFDTIVKLPGNFEKALALAEYCAEYRIVGFHCGNTVFDDPPAWVLTEEKTTTRVGLGSLSGYPAKAVNLGICAEIAKRYPGIPVIGGGGIYTFDDLIDYRNAGATHFSLATVWFRPWRALSIIQQYEAEYALRDHSKPKARELHADGVS